MTKYIGDVALPSIQEVNFSLAQEQEESDMIGKDENILSIGSEAAVAVEVSFTLLEKIHPNNLSVEEQEDQVKSLTANEYEENMFEYDGMEGMISVQSVNTPEEGSSDTIREGTLSGLFLPWPKHKFNTPYGQDEYGSGRYGL